MTNVPQNIREMWTELYKAFDRHYLMQNSPEAWKAFWEEAEQTADRFSSPRMMEGFVLIADIIGDRMKKERSECL